MPRGGPRTGAGRKAGAVSKATAARKALIEEASKEGLTPLEYMLQVLRNENEEKSVRLDAAKSAAPYMHPRLAAVEHSGNKDNPVSFTIATGVPREAID